MIAPVVPDWDYELGVAGVSLERAIAHLGRAKGADDEGVRTAHIRATLTSLERLGGQLRGLLGPEVAIAPEAVADPAPTKAPKRQRRGKADA